MGLDVYVENDGTELWHGAYSAFSRFRIYIARMAGICLEAMWGYVERGPFKEGKIYCPFWMHHENAIDNVKYMNEKYEPIPFPPKEEEPLVILLDHSDCDGEIEIEDLEPLSKRLTQLYNRMEDKEMGGHIGNIKEKTKFFIDGLNKAIELQERVLFR